MIRAQKVAVTVILCAPLCDATSPLQAESYCPSGAFLNGWHSSSAIPSSFPPSCLSFLLGPGNRTYCGNLYFKYSDTCESGGGCHWWTKARTAPEGFGPESSSHSLYTLEPQGGARRLATEASVAVSLGAVGFQRLCYS